MQNKSGVNLFTANLPSAEREGLEIAEGECGVIVSPDGSFRVFSTGIDVANLSQEQIAMGEKLMALTLALSNDQVMHVLLDLVRNVIDPEDLKSVYH